MSEERAVHRDCRNASNPYHECSDYCFRVIAEAIIRMQQQESEVAQASGGSGREQAIPDESYPDEGIHDDRPKPQEDSDSDPDQPVVENMDGAYPKLSTRQKKWMELRAKMQEAKKRNQIEIAAEKKRMEAPTESRGVSKHKWLDDRKRKIGKLLDANGLDLTKAYMLDTQEAAEEKYKKWEKDPAPVGWDVFNQKSLYNAYKKRTKNIEVDVEEYNRMREADPEFYREASSLQYGKQAGDKNPSPKVVPITSYDDTGESLSTSAAGSKHFCYSGVLHGNDDSDGEESQSVVSESRVPVGKYHVKESFAPILLSIFDKYGDIGEGCHLESVVMRSYYIECVCFVAQELQSTSIMELSKSKVKELLAILNDVESAQLRVAWLRSIVNEIAENIELINEHHAVEVAKANFDREMESLRKELESEEETLAQKEQEITDTKTRIEGIRERLSELELKASDLENNMSSIKSKADNLDGRSLLNELV